MEAQLGCRNDKIVVTELAALLQRFARDSIDEVAK
jgi:hypothetical protein